ncbi:hypothetical protein J2S94_001368, partial [Arthrobacter bambusae]|nr:hypothetical protein [Arthrobacter bambusae]
MLQQLGNPLRVLNVFSELKMVLNSNARADLRRAQQGGLLGRPVL